jgi:hypothetical protein
MKPSSTPGRPPAPDRHAAWACTLANLLALPGLGSLTAGRRVGWAQAALALVGFALTLHGLVQVVREVLASPEFLLEITPAVWRTLTGLAVSFVAWFWSLVTSLQVHREVRARERLANSDAPKPPRVDV